ncbi:serine/threonine-protein kinase HT1 [Selaginella moellendorffii]|nr:serine/threonine-protein kinase HT1 [Selaginella moellendorffii]|eukprot:XP_002969519.2 serine/threonine-protein kinase HT1 [Selaginella moellendorffii]
MGELSRYRFSRSVCHRMDLLSLSRDEEEGHGEESPRSKSKMSSVAAAPAPPAPAPGTPPPVRTQSDRRHSLPKASYAKSLSGPLPVLGSDDGKCSSPSAALPCGEHQPKRELRRLVSWSRYLEPRGDEQAVEAAEEWMIDLSKLLLGPRFASGAHSRLYHGIYQGKAVAVKVTRHPQGCESATIGTTTLDKLFAREVSLLSRLRHPNVVQLVGAWKRPPVCCVVTEYLAGGSLKDFLRSNGGAALPLRMVVDMALDIARGIRYLHSQGVVHRDLKSANLILDDEFNVKITDFGVAALESECGDSVTSDVGTFRWMAPELVNGKAHSRKVDAYSFAIVLWELLTRQTPFQDMTPVQAAFAVVNKNARPEVPRDCPSVLSQLMQRCWSLDPHARPDFEQLVETLEQFQLSMERNWSSRSDDPLEKW